MIATGFAVLPAAKKQLGLGPQTRQFMQAFQRKLKVLVYISIVGLVVTGVLMSSRSSQFQGLLTWSSPYSVILALKHLLAILMIVIALVRSLVFGRVKVPAAVLATQGGNLPV